MSKFLTKCVVLLICILLLNSLIGMNLPAYWGNEVIYKKMHQMALEKEIVNTLFIGTSRIHCHVSPIKFDQSVKSSYSFNISSPGAAGLETLKIVDNIIENRKEIKYIFVEFPSFNTPPQKNINSVRANYFYDWKAFSYSIRYLFAKPIAGYSKFKLLPYSIKLYLKNFFSLGYLKTIIEIKIDNQQYSLSKSRGFNGLKKTIKSYGSVKSRLQQAKKYYRAVQGNSHPKENTFLTKVLLDNINKAAQKGITLIYVLPPKIPLEKYEANFPSLLKLPIKNRLNLSNPSEYPEFYQKKNSSDKAHLNIKGAKLFTKEIAKHTNKYFPT